MLEAKAEERGPLMAVREGLESQIRPDSTSSAKKGLRAKRPVGHAEHFLGELSRGWHLLLRHEFHEQSSWLGHGYDIRIEILRTRYHACNG